MGALADQDSLRRFIFEKYAVHGKLAHLDATWLAILERYDYPPVIRAVLGEAMVATVLLASTLKFDGVLTLQLQGDGPLNLLVIQCSSKLSLRGLARWQSEVTEGSLASMAGEGKLTITIESGSEGHRYQGVVPLTGDTLADCIQAYFEQSEQLQTRLWLSATNSRVAGMLLQRGADSGIDDDPEEREAWNRVCILAETLSDEELLSLSDEVILHRLFHQEEVRMFESAPLSFRCTCSQERVESMLKSMGGDEVRGIIEERGAIDVRCEFCNKAYEFDAVDAEKILLKGSDAGSSGSIH